MVRPEKLANEAITSRISVSWKVTVIGGCCDCCACENRATGTMGAATRRGSARTGSGSGSTAMSSMSSGSGSTTAAGFLVASAVGRATGFGAAGGAAAYVLLREGDQLEPGTDPPEK